MCTLQGLAVNVNLDLTDFNQLIRNVHKCTGHTVIQISCDEERILHHCIWYISAVLKLFLSRPPSEAEKTSKLDISHYQYGGGTTGIILLYLYCFITIV